MRSTCVRDGGNGLLVLSPPHGSAVVNALEEVLQDPSFKTSSPVAAGALQAATTLLQWCQDAENEPAVSAFSEKLVMDLSEPFAASSSGRRPLNREKLWKALWSVRSSSGFTSRWIALCEKASALPTPVLYQHLTDMIFRKLVREKYQISDQTRSADPPEMSYNEANVVRYAAGYVIRHVSKKIKKKNHPSEKELLCCAQQLLKGGQQATDSIDPGTTEDWTDLVDRGGLWHIRETTFHVFCALEEETRPYVGALCSQISTAATIRNEFLDKLVGNEDVQFYWCIAAANFDTEDVDYTIFY